MYRNGGNNRRAVRAPPNGAAPPNSGAQQQPQVSQDAYSGYYQPNGGAYTGPQSPAPAPGATGAAYGANKYGGYDGSAAWAYPTSPPAAPAPTTYSHQQSPRQQQQQQPSTSSFYNHQWDPQPTPPNAYQQQNGSSSGSGVGMLPHQQPQPMSPAPPGQQASFYNPNAHAAAQQQHGAYQYNAHTNAGVGQQQQGGFVPNLQNAVPLMMAGMQLAAGAGAGGMPTGLSAQNAQNFAYLGQQMLNTYAPTAAQMLANRDAVSTFMRLPKYYFQVNHGYVRRKLLLLLKPWGARTWVRQRAVQTDPSQPEYLPPRDDVNAPDLYIPLMAFATYVLLAGFVLASRNAFKPQVLAQYLSKGAGVLTLEAVVIKLGLYLINSRNAPWLDVIAYRGYKFVGVALTMAATLVHKRLYWPMSLYSATAMGIFLMRSHRRIVLPRDDNSNATELHRRNAFLLFLWLLQYPVYWVLILA